VFSSPPDTPPPILALQCQDTSDFARLFYLICSRSLLCKDLYSLDVARHNNSFVYEHDFDSFKYDITRITFFPASNSSGGPVDWDGHPLTYYIWPPEWQPPVTLDYTANYSAEPCSETTDLSGNTSESLMFVDVSLDLMKTYRAFISNAYRCNDYNEQPIYDLVSGQFYCAPVQGKLSHVDANHRQIMFFMAVLQNALTLTLLVAVVLIGIKIMNKHRADIV
jgi:hypothetical protein